MTNFAMMEESSCVDLYRVLDVLEENTFDTPTARNQNYILVQNALDNGVGLSDSIVDRIMSICMEAMKDDKKYCGNVLLIISSILKKVKLCDIVYKLINILPQEKKTVFVQEFLSIFFKLVPTIVDAVVNLNSSKSITTLECLTAEVKTIDYAGNAQWEVLFESIYNPKKFPAIMKNLLESGNCNWYRLWIAFIKLLKNQITRSNTNLGSPINSLLPVVENAFKMDAINRCRAFLCWEVLIDNFLPETNEVYLAKRLKLLLIPLHSNNAKSQDIAIAKFRTWWHLIRQFQHKIDKFIDQVIISFLHFCFGKNVVPQKVIFVPGLLSFETKKLGIEAFIEIAGHLDCNGCGNLLKLNGRIINTNTLVSYWNHFAYSLQKTIFIVANEPVGITTAQVLCLWKSFILTIGELPANNIRKDIFTELLSVLVKVTQDCEKDDIPLDKVSDMILTLVFSLFDHCDKKIEALLKTKVPKYDGPMYKIIKILLGPASNLFYKSDDEQQSVKRLKPVTDFIMDKTLCCSDELMDWILKNLHPNDNILILWTALAESVFEKMTELSESNLYELLLWPVKYISKFSEIRVSALRWYSLYGAVYSEIKKTNLNKEITRILSTLNITNTNKYFMLSVALALVKYNLVDSKTKITCGKEIEILTNVIHKLESYESVEKEFPILVDTLVLLMTSLLQDENESLALHAVTATINVLKLLAVLLENDTKLIVFIEILLSPIKQILKSKTYSQLKVSVIGELIEVLSIIGKHSLLKLICVSILDTCLLNTKDSDTSFVNDVKNALDIMKSNGSSSKASINQKLDKNDFTSPKAKISAKITKKKETKIINTVVENGEEYVVVKSNWKFNPKNLTENQKEKLQRKREDIPALYQDLSQSQDEFKLTTWKTDSQDTSTTNSKSSETNSTSDKVTTILKNIPSSDVVPKIIENIFSDNKKEVLSNDNSNKTKAIPTIVKDPKTPRIALKDRVFRNVRNLIEKSSLQKESKDMSESLIQIENISKSPLITDTSNVNVTNSAPPKLNTERPSRVKRKPRKFDDSELFLNVKRGRRHSIQMDSQLDNDVSEIPIESKSTKESDIINKDGIVSNEYSSVGQNMENVKQITVSDNDNIPISDDKHINNSCENVKIQEHQTPLYSSNMLVNNQAGINNSISTDLSECGEQKFIIEKKSIDGDSLGGVETKIVTTPKPSKKKDLQQSSTKKSSTKKSRIEKELAIDMVEGHPFLKVQSEKRLTRKNLNNSMNSGRRKSLTEKLNKSKLDLKPNLKIDKKLKEKDKINVESTCATSNSQNNKAKYSDSSEDFPCSEDVIESSQDSTITTVSTKSTKQANKRSSLVAVDPIVEQHQNHKSVSESQNIFHINNQATLQSVELPVEQESKDDTVISQNKTALDSQKEVDLTENMDTESINIEGSNEVIIVNDEEEQPIIIDTENSIIGTETQELADADTEPIKPDHNLQVHEHAEKSKENIRENIILDSTANKNLMTEESAFIVATNTSISPSESNKDLKITKDNNDASSPLKDEAQRKKDFLDNTLEISPIKTMSPVRDKKSPSPETSNDYVVIKLTSPVHSNGEPFGKCESPEIFTEDKNSPSKSPDKRDQSPPRQEISLYNNTSPSSSLSLKKNKSQVRTGGRAAQMLGLCMPVADRLQPIINLDRCDPEEIKKSNPCSTSARRNLRILYNSVSDNNEHSEENESSEIFLKLKRSLPTTDSTPTGPILKRKLAEIADDATISPANKRKRVSFHDPPVSTTISVQKYIEPSGIRSPQSSAIKRQERQTRSQINMKSPKRLDNVFKLESVLTKAVESFNETDQNMRIDDTQLASLDETPAVEIVKTSDLNNIDPICPDLINCTDPIDIIASDLSSSTTKLMFLKELEGKIITIGDLAKMTELEVNRLCIKAPKIKIAKKVLTDYALKKTVHLPDEQIIRQDVDTFTQETMLPIKAIDIEIQTDNTVMLDVEVQTISVPLKCADAQTEKVQISDTAVQTKESGRQPTKEVIASCLSERSDFIQNLEVQLEDESKQCIAESLPFTTLTNSLVKQVTDSNAQIIISRVLGRVSETSESKENNELSFLQQFLCERFHTNDLILFCSQLLQNIHKKGI
ncbi:telomere-associated protein RIF1 isoform X2 [Galleria mellonella]|uniref:Telomere-associated protein RIF1 isoform X2 n=1 Tax=Galleria mellonella TaxID=7137 RepID=A0ABM3N1R1_GALME|nr:telomere-associated protein RIF1 isoform X2 [Galleria mellonella]